jgi:hypothetical protein
MTSAKYIGMDVHTESTSIAVRNSVGKVVMECVIETKASTILQFIDGLRADLRVTFEEGTWAAWLYDLLKPHVSEVLVCNTPFLAAARKCMHRVTVRNGSPRSAKPVSGDAPNTSTSSSMSCGSCARKHGEICCWKPRSTRRGNCYARFRGSVRFEPPFCSR